MTATLVDNSSTRALIEMLERDPLTIKMSDYGNFEKVGEIGITLPVNDEEITTQSGDLILYLGTRFVIYYDENSWRFTRLGKINDISQNELRELLGDGDVEVTLYVESKKPSGKLGDVNGNGAINAEDALLALQHAARLITLDEDQILRADVKRDGTVNAADALRILQYAARIIDEF